MTKAYYIPTDGQSITCLLCGFTSHNKIDVGMRYCGHCHEWIGEGCCDFCMTPGPPNRAYRAVSKIVGELVDGRPIMDGDELWEACPECERLIEAGLWTELLDRGAAACSVKWGLDHENEITREKLIWMYQAVFGEKFTVSK